MAKPVYQYLIVAVDESEIEGYYLLTDNQMGKADRRCEEDGDYWDYLSNRKGCRHFDDIMALTKFINDNGVVIEGQFGCTTY
jgi:hypothetical protein